MSKSRWKAMLVLIALAAVAIGCGSDREDSSADEQPDQTGEATERYTVDLAYFEGALVTLPTVVAEEEGFFDAHNLDVNRIGFASGTDVISALQSGSADIAMHNTEAFLRLVQQGQSIQELVGIMGPMGLSIVGVSDENWASVGEYPEIMGELAGRTVGVPTRGGIPELVVRALMEDAGEDPDSITFVGLAGPALALPALEERQVDAYVAFEPIQTLSIDVNGSGEMLLDLRKGEGSDLFETWEFNGFAATTDYLESNADAAEAFSAAITDAIDYITDPANHDAVVAAVAGFLGVDQATAEYLVTNNADTWDAELTEPGYENVIEFMVQAGELSAPIPFDSFVFGG